MLEDVEEENLEEFVRNINDWAKKQKGDTDLANSASTTCVKEAYSRSGLQC